MSDNQKPFVWAVMDGEDAMEFCIDKEEAKSAAKFYGVRHIVPLYRSATLTDAEREAIGMAAAFYDTRATAVHQHWASTLRGLLERMK